MISKWYGIVSWMNHYIHSNYSTFGFQKSDARKMQSHHPCQQLHQTKGQNSTTTTKTPARNTSETYSDSD